MLLNQEIDDIYLYEMLRNFGMDLIGIFIPIYIASQGFGFKYAIGFLIIEQLGSLVLSAPISYLISRIGFKHSLVLSYIFLLPSLLFIRTEALTIEIIVFSAIIYSAGKIFHGLALESEFAVASHRSKRESESSKMLGLPNISRFLAPLAGGVILSFYGFNILLTTSLLFFIVSIAILLRSEEHRDPLSYNLKSILYKNYRKTVPIFFVRGILNITAVTMFALFTYYFIGDSVDVGMVASIDNLGLLVTALVSGKLSQKFGRKAIIVFGLLGSAIVHFSRIFVTSPIEAILVSGIGGVVFMFYEVPLFSDYADIAEDQDVLEFYALKRFFFKAGQLLTTLIIVGTGLKFGLEKGFQVSFAIAGLSSVLIIYWARKELK